jgi:hypothetical protein
VIVEEGYALMATLRGRHNGPVNATDLVAPSSPPLLACRRLAAANG